MNYLLLGLILLVGVLQLLLVGFCFFRVWKMSQTAVSQVQSFVTAPDDKTPSPLAQTVQQMARVIGSETAMMLKTQVMGELSGATRQAESVGRQMAMENMAETNPNLAAIIGSLGVRKQNKLLKNPLLMSAIEQLVGRFAGGNHGASVSSSNRPKFSL